MKLRARRHKFFFFWLATAIVLVQLFACSGEDNEVMSRNKMRRVLVEVHLLEGIFATKNPPLSEREQVYYYQALFRKHNTTKEAFDSTLAYFTRRPKSFERLYIRVMNDLNLLNEKVIAGKFHPLFHDSLLLIPLEYNLWHRSTEFLVDNDSLLHWLKFSISDPALMTQDVYQWRFRIMISPQDTSENINAIIRLHYANGVVDSVIHPLTNDSLLRRYRFTVRASRLSKVDSISGIFMGSTKYAGIRMVSVDSISLIRRYLPAIQDSLRLKIDTLGVDVPDSIQDAISSEGFDVDTTIQHKHFDVDRLPQRDPRRIRRAEDSRVDNR